MGLTKLGEIQHRSQYSQCQKCSMFIKDLICWQYSMIPYQVWENCVGYECSHFNSILKNQLNSHYIFQDYEDRDRFPEKKFGGKYRFNSKGERI